MREIITKIIQVPETCRWVDIIRQIARGTRERNIKVSSGEDVRHKCIYHIL